MVKLPSSLVEAIDNEYKEYPAQSMLDSALALARDGWNVFPLVPGKKHPLISSKSGGRGCLDGTTDEAQIRKWWKQYPNANIGANLGDDRIAFDLDFQKGAVHLAAFPDTRTHYSGRDNGNVHLIYQIEPGSKAAGLSLSAGELGPGLDVRATRGGYIVMPPSTHPDTGKPYRLDPARMHEHTLTDEELDAIFAEAGVDLTTAKRRGASKGLSVVEGAKNWQRPMESSNTTLAGLKADLPGPGERNQWLTRVCGHLAKAHRDKEDVYREWVKEYAALMADPLSEEEIDKTADSIWKKEHADHPERELNDHNGHLTGNKRALFCQTAHKEGDVVVYATGVYADFDVEARGVAIDDSFRRVFWVRLLWAGKVIETTLPAGLLGNDAKTREWLAERGLSIDPPFTASPKTPAGTRLLRYLNSQSPPEVSIVATLGWDEKSGHFVTHEGVITPDGPKSKEEVGVVANPELVIRDVAPYHYGFSRDAKEAQRVLREVLTFQYEDTSSLFGAWWAACLLKPQIQERTSLFPFFGIEAASESGKTNGFFDLMVALNGNTRGQVVPTVPVLRDFASANRSGIVWADDLDSLDKYGEILRGSTSNGSVAKMSADRSSVTNTEVVAPILFSGEALGFADQKAMVDRSVVLQIASPKGRESKHGKYPQWDDIVKLKAEYPESVNGLSSLAGHYVQHALGHQKEVLRALTEEARKGTGRHAEKLAVLRAGARLLDSLAGHEDPWGEDGGEHYQRVDEWCKRNEQVLSQHNALTRKILPWALGLWDFPTVPEIQEGGKFDKLKTPVWVEGDLESTQTLGGELGVKLWYSPKLLAQAWAREAGGRVDLRTESETALKQQADALGKSGGTTNKRVGGEQQSWRQLPPEYVSVVLETARS